MCKHSTRAASTHQEHMCILGLVASNMPQPVSAPALPVPVMHLPLNVGRHTGNKHACIRRTIIVFHG